MSGLTHKPWPRNLRVRIADAAGTKFDVTQYVQRQGLSIAMNGDASTASSSIPLQIPNNADLGFDIEAWQRIYVDNPTPRLGSLYERYFTGFISEPNSDPAADNHYYTLQCVPPQILLAHPPQNISRMTFPAGTTDKAIITELVSGSGFGAELAATTSVNNLFNITEEMIFQNQTLEEALRQLADKAPAGTEVIYLVNWAADDAGHADNWQLRLHWFSPDLIPTGAIDLTDIGPESSSKAFYSGMSRQRRGLQVVNRQTVVGKDPDTEEEIRYTHSDTASHNYLGRWLSGKTIVDDSLTTLAAVQARAEAEVDRWKNVLETLSNVKTLYPYLPSGFGATGAGGGLRVRIKRDTEPGLGSYTTYFVASIKLQWDSAGLPEYLMNLGTEPPRLGERGAGSRGGVAQLQDTDKPPDLVWRNTPDDVPGNSYDDVTRTVTVTWDWAHYTPPGDWLEYRVRYRIDGGLPVYVPGAVRLREFVLPGLPFSTPTDPHTVELGVLVRDTHRNASNWSAWRLVDLEDQSRPESPTGITLDLGVPGGTGYAYDSLGAIGYFTYTPPANVPHRYQVRLRLNVGGAIVQEFVVPSSLDPVEVHGLARATDYILEMAGLSDSNTLGIWSSGAFNIPAASPPAPTVTRDNTTLPPSGFGYNRADAYMQVAIAPAAYSPVPGGEIHHWELAAITPPAIGVVGSELAAVLTHRFETITRNTSYTYKARGVTEFGDVGNWGSFTYSVPNITIPAPTGLALDDTSLPPFGYAFTASGASAHIKWVAPSYTPEPGAEIFAWRISYQSGSGSGWITLPDIPAATVDQLIEGINRGQTLTVAVAGISRWGDVGTSGSNAFLIPSGEPPPPYDLGLDLDLYGPFGYGYEPAGVWVGITWTNDDTGQPPGGERDHYTAQVVNVNDGSIIFWQDLIHPASTRTRVFGLARGVNYEFQIWASNSFGEEGILATFPLTIAAASPPAAYHLSYDAPGWNEAGAFAAISWSNDDTAQPDGGGRDHYRITVAAAGTDNWILELGNADPAMTGLLVTGLQRLVEYEMRITAVTLYGDLGPVAIQTFTVPAEDPDPPTAITRDSTGIPPSGYGWDDAGAFIGLLMTLPDPVAGVYYPYTHIWVYETVSGTVVQNYYHPGDNPGIFIQGLTRGVNYTFAFASRTQYGDESTTPTLFTYTVPAATPPAPTALAPDTTGLTPVGYGWDAAGGYAQLKWTNTNTTQPPGGARATYEARLLLLSGPIASGTVLWAAKNISGSATTKVVPGIPRGVLVEFQIWAVTALDDAGPAATVQFTIPAASPPAPTSLHLDTAYPSLGYGWDGAGPFAYVAWTNTNTTQPPGGARTRYFIRALYAGTDNIVYENLRGAVNLASIRIPLPKRATNFDFVITPVTLYGDEGSPGTLTLNVPTEPAPAVPTLSGRKTDKGVGFSAVWTAPSSWNISGWILRWRVQGGSGKWYSQRFGKDTLEAVVDGLLRAATYEVIIVGVTEDGTTEVPSATATIVAGSISRIGPPNTPLGLYHPDSTTPGWTKDAGSSANAVYTQETGSSVVHSGEAIHKLAITSTAAGTCTVNEDVTQQVKAGYGYDYDVYVRGDVNGVGTARAKLQWINSSGSVISTSTLFGLPVLLAGSSYRSTVVAPALAVRVRWILEYTVTGTISAAYFDTPILKDSLTVPPILWDSTEPPVQAATFDAYSQAGYVLIQALNSKQWRWIGPAGEIDILTSSMEITGSGTSPLNITMGGAITAIATGIITLFASSYALIKSGLQFRTYAQWNDTSDARVSRETRGSSFPVSPNTNDTHVHDTYGWCRWNGANWVGPVKEWFAYTNNQTLSATPTTLVAGGGPVGLKVRLKSMYLKVVYRTTNSVGNKWVWALNYLNSGLGAGTVASLDSSTPTLYAINTVYTHEVVINAVWDFSTGQNNNLYIDATRTGSAGNPEIRGILITYEVVYG